MTNKQAKALRVDQRVRWESSDERGTVKSNSGKHVEIQWDDEDFARTYPTDFRGDGLLHVQTLSA